MNRQSRDVALDLEPVGAMNHMVCRTEREPWIIAAAFTLALISYIVLALLFMPSSDPMPPPGAKLFPPDLQQFVVPEPQEKFLYLFGLCCIPILPTLFYAVLCWLNNRSPNRFAWMDSRKLMLIGDTGIIIGIVGWLCALGRHTDIVSMWLKLAMVLPVAMLLPMLQGKVDHKTRVVFGVLAALLIVLCATLSCQSEDRLLQYTGMYHHFDLMLGAVNQVYHGKTILVDTTSQYGILYPYMAALAAWPFGLTPVSLMGFFVATSVVALVFLYLAIARKTGFGTPLSLALFLGVTSLVHTFFSLWRPVGQLFDAGVFYQCYPLRILFPMFFFWFVPFYFSHRSRWMTLLGYALAGVAVLWNADTGMVVLIAWTGTMLFDVLATRDFSPGRVLRGTLAHASLAVLVLLAVVGLYGAFAWLRSGHFPAIAAYSQSQRMFYTMGYYMLPMKTWEFWQPLMLIYVLAVFHCMRRLLKRNVDDSTRWYFFLAVCGAGVFSYYQGRSHHGNLLGVIYPAALLSGLMAFDLWAECRSAGGLRRLFTAPWRYKTIVALSLFLLPAMGIVHFCQVLPSTIARVTGHMPARKSVAEIGSQVELVRKYIGRSEAVFLSQHDAYFHVKCNSASALPQCSPLEIIMNRQFEEAQKVIDSDDVQWLVVSQPTPNYIPRFHFKKFRAVAVESDIVLLQKIPASEQGKPQRPPARSCVNVAWVQELLMR